MAVRCRIRQVCLTCFAIQAFLPKDENGDLKAADSKAIAKFNAGLAKWVDADGDACKVSDDLLKFLADATSKSV